MIYIELKDYHVKKLHKKYNVTDGAISYQLKKFGIPIYSPSEAINIYLYEKGGIEKEGTLSLQWKIA